mmetsp:Transcript_1500/g.2035  ORF Transcript_1500/g.2035 Transcript_1500/m.2035 type:complete len:277 (+) Transcript_1500:64-894(+)
MSAMPESIGLVGVGTIGSSMIRGLCKMEGAKPKFIISPRGAAKAQALKEEFPDLITIAGSNQEVVEAVKCVIIAVLPKQVDEVLKELTFRPEQQVLSVIASLPYNSLKEAIVPATECAVGVPLPAVARRQGATLVMPQVDFAKAIFDALGTCVAVDEEKEFKRMQVMCGMMGDFYKRQLTAQEWLVEHGVDKSQAGAWIGAIFATMAADSSRAEADTLQKLVEEQTPGGVNELVWKGQEEDGVYTSMRYAMDQAHVRFVSGKNDADLAPAAMRKKA